MRPASRSQLLSRLHDTKARLCIAVKEGALGELLHDSLAVLQQLSCDIGCTLSPCQSCLLYVFAVAYIFTLRLCRHKDLS